MKAIADAIREKDGTDAPISANDFPARILAIQTGGGSDFAAPLVVTTDAGAQITAVNGNITVNGTAGEDGTATLILTAPGEWTVTAEWNGKTKAASVVVEDGYSVKIMVSWQPRLPEGYTEVEYIQSDQACSINTGHMINFNTDRIVLDIEALDYSGSREYVFASYNVVGNYVCDLSRFSAEIINTKFGTQSMNYAADISNKRIIIDCDFTKNTIAFGDESHSVSKNAQTASSVLCLFRGNTAVTKSVRAKLYSAQTYSAGVIKCNLVPCIRDSDGRIGMYDLAATSDNFKQHSANNFIAGPVLG